jgi:hypothetical protein
LLDRDLNDKGNATRKEIVKRLTFSIPTSVSEGQKLQWSEIRDHIRDHIKYHGEIRNSGPGYYTLLHACAEYGDVRGLQELIKLGASINAPDRHGDSPLTRAVIARRSGYIIDKAVLCSLLEAGADVGMRCMGRHQYNSEQQNPDSALTLLQMAKGYLWPWPGTSQLVVNVG